MFASSTVHEAIGKLGALPPRIKPVEPSWRLSGPAFPVATPPRNNLFLHQAIMAAPAGSVIVADTGGELEAGYWGEIMTHAALARGIAGLVIDGAVRDGEQLRTLDFPVFSAGLCIRGTGKGRTGGQVGGPVTIGSILVRAGDLVVGDGDGVVVVPQEDVAAALVASEAREREEQDIIRRLRNGESTLDIYRLRGEPS